MSIQVASQTKFTGLDSNQIIEKIAQDKSGSVVLGRGVGADYRQNKGEQEAVAEVQKKLNEFLKTDAGKNAFQEELKKAGIDTKGVVVEQIAADGKFGAMTETAVKAFQRENKLKADGIVGSQTLGKLGFGVSASSPPQLQTLEMPSAVEHKPASGNPGLAILDAIRRGVQEKGGSIDEKSAPTTTTAMTDSDAAIEEYSRTNGVLGADGPTTDLSSSSQPTVFNSTVEEYSQTNGVLTATDSVAAPSSQIEPMIVMPKEQEPNPSLSSLPIGNARVIASARNQLGKGEEGAENTGQYIKEILNVDRQVNGRHAPSDGFPWCAGFVSHVLENAQPNLLRGHHNDVGELRNEFKTTGAYKPFDSGYAPKPGDLMFFPRGHVAIVESVENGVIHTIEGNVPHPDYVRDDGTINWDPNRQKDGKPDQVRRRQYTMEQLTGDNTVDGFGSVGKLYDIAQGRDTNRQRPYSPS